MATYPGHVPDAGGMNEFRRGQVASLQRLAANRNAARPVVPSVPDTGREPDGEDDD